MIIVGDGGIMGAAHDSLDHPCASTVTIFSFFFVNTRLREEK